MPAFTEVIPLLVYADIPAAHDFLVTTLGFAAGEVVRTPEGEAVHAEVRVGKTTIWLHRVTEEHRLTSPGSANMRSGGLMVFVDDVDAHYAHARDAGADIVSEPTTQPYGQRDYGVRDVEGHLWWFGTRL